MFTKKLKYIELSWNDDVLRIFGNNNYVKGDIFVKRNYLYSIFVFIARIFRSKRSKE